MSVVARKTSANTHFWLKSTIWTPVRERAEVFESEALAKAAVDRAAKFLVGNKRALKKVRYMDSKA